MSEPKVSPLLDAMEVGECFSKHDGVCCYHILHPESGREFVLKHISVPASQEQVEALLLTGAYASAEEADDYYRKVAEDLIREAEERKKLLDCPFILPFLGVQMDKKEEGVGYDVYAVLPKRNSLQSFLEENAISHLRGINMGIDLCVALSALREEGYVHGNLKPGNVFFSDSGRFLLGDFGLISTEDMQYTVLPEQYRSGYTAPELSNYLGGLNTTVDIYSLGMILYRIYNGNHAPFEDEQTNAKAADASRLEGKPLPAPIYADYELAGIISKACAYEPADRYQTPDEMRTELERYMRRNAVSDHLIVPPLVIEDGPLSAEEQEEPIEPVRANDVESLDENFKTAFAPDEKNGKKQKKAEKADQTDKAPEKAKPAKKKWSKGWIAFALVMVLLVAGIGLYEFTDLGHGLYHYFVTVENLEVTDLGVDSLRLKLKASVEEDQFKAVCEDAYGNVYNADFEDGTASFAGLNPGTQYTLRVNLPGRHKVSGTTSVLAVTLPQAEVLRFTAGPGPSVGSVQLNLTVKDDNVVPEEWTLRYGKAGGAEQEVRFAGESYLLSGLEPGAEYSFRLVQEGELSIAGELETACLAPRAITVTGLQLEDVLDGSAYVCWRCAEEPPARWELACADGEGQAMEIEFRSPVQEGDAWLCSAKIKDVDPAKTYTLKLAAPDCIFQPMTLSFYGTVIRAEDLVLERIQDGTAYLRWYCASDLPDQWILTCADGEDRALTPDIYEAVQEEERYYCTAAVPGLVPGATYTAELYALGMTEPLTVEFGDYAYYISGFTAAVSGTEIQLTWSADREPEAGWLVKAAYGAGLEAEQTVTGDGCSFSLVPQTSYTFTLTPADGSEISGTNTVTLTTPAADRFSGLGVGSTGTTIGTYYTPTKENWTEKDLGGGTVRFRATDSITFRIAVKNTPEDTDQEVLIQYLIRNEKDEIIHVDEERAAWNSLWKGRQWMDQIPWLPEEPGSYSFTVLVNGLRMGTINFTIKN